jgi:peroxiredoxin
MAKSLHAALRSSLLRCIAFCATILMASCDSSQSTAPRANVPAPQLGTTTILTPAGDPASGASVVVVPRGHDVDVTDGQSFDDDPAYQRSAANAQGQVRLTPTTQPFLVVIVHPTGYAQFRHSPEPIIHLQPWGQIKGTFMIGSKPAVAQNVIAWIAPDVEGDEPDTPAAMYISELKTDDHGHFLMPRVAVGSVAVAPHPTPDAIERPMLEIEVEPAKTAGVTIGGQGRPVVGRVDIPLSIAAQKGWTFRNCFASPRIDPVVSPMPAELRAASLEDQAKWWHAFESTDANKLYKDAISRRYKIIHARTYQLFINADGAFRIDDVVPGDYLIDCRIVQMRGNTPVKRIGECKANFTVSPIPGGRTDQPLLIPPLQVNTGLLQAGDPAPDFTVPALHGPNLKLTDYRGKYLLIDFWATWCGPCMGDMDATKDLYKTFAPDPRFAMIGLTLDYQPDAPIQYIAKKGIGWRQGLLANDWDNPVLNAYDVPGIPCLYLISPEGKIIGHAMRAEDMKPIIVKALGQ